MTLHTLYIWMSCAGAVLAWAMAVYSILLARRWARLHDMLLRLCVDVWMIRSAWGFPISKIPFEVEAAANVLAADAWQRKGGRR